MVTPHTCPLPLSCIVFHFQFIFFCFSSDTFQDVLPGILPFFHIYGLVIMLLRAVLNGTKIVTLSKFEAETFIALLKDHRVYEGNNKNSGPRNENLY